MKNIYDVIQHKEAQIQQLQRELEALKVAAAILDAEAGEDGSAKGAAASGNRPQVVETPARTGSESTKRWP